MRRLLLTVGLCLLSYPAFAACPASLLLQDAAAVQAPAMYTDNGSGLCMVNMASKDGALATVGTTSDAAWVSGSGSLVAIEKLIANNSNTIVTNTGTSAGAVSGGVVQSNTKQVNGTTTLTGTGAVGAGAQRVAVGTDTATIAGSAPGTAGSASANVLSVQGIASMTPVQVSQATAANLNATVSQSTGTNLHIVCDSGCSSSTAPADESAFTFGTTPQSPVGGVFQTTATNNPLTTGQMGAFQVTANRALFTNLRNAAGTEIGTAATPVQVSLANTGANGTAVLVNQPTAANFNATVVQATAANLNAQVVGAGTAGTPSGGVVSVQTPYAAGAAGYPPGAVPITASATGTTAATTATLAAAVSKTTYVCSFSIRANATAAATGNATVTGTISGTLNFTQWTAPAANGLGVSEMIFTPCVPGSTTNTAIAVVSAAPGTGGVVSVTATGFQL